MTRRIFAATWDHPRIRGEHRLSRRCFRHRWGSSPHTRGAPFQVCRCWLGWRIIPAYAGSTWAVIGRNAGFTDHPRIRGEHCRRTGRSGRRRGSSPHTRGARSKLYVCIYKHADHPRIRGEHRRPGGPFGQRRGSSPHTRGAPAYGNSILVRLSIIPAYAGSTRAARAR